MYGRTHTSPLQILNCAVHIQFHAQHIQIVFKHDSGISEIPLCLSKSHSAKAYLLYDVGAVLYSFSWKIAVKARYHRHA